MTNGTHVGIVPHIEQEVSSRKKSSEQPQYQLRCPDCERTEVKQNRVDAIAHQRSLPCPNCNRMMGVSRMQVASDGGQSIYACDTPHCDSLKEVVTPDGYVCHDCANELARQYENIELLADGGVRPTGGDGR